MGLGPAPPRLPASLGPREAGAGERLGGTSSGAPGLLCGHDKKVPGDDITCPEGLATKESWQKWGKERMHLWDEAAGYILERELVEVVPRVLGRVGLFRSSEANLIHGQG